AETPRDLACRHSGRKLQANNLARLAHRHSFRWHRSPPWIAKGANLTQASGGARRRVRPPGGIIPFRWAASSRNGRAASFRCDGRHHLVLVGGFARNQHLDLSANEPVRNRIEKVM